jgi:PAS domain S-box-containing protein
MTFLRDLPIRQKMVSVILLTSSIAVLLAGGALFIFQTFLVRRAFERDLKALASIVADSCVAPVVLQDQKAALDVLATLRSKTQIVAVTIRLLDHAVFAHLGDRALPQDFAASPGTPQVHYEGDQVVVCQPIETSKELLGVLILRGDFGPSYLESLRLFVGVLAVITMGALLAAFALATLLQKVITQPIHQLAEVAQRIAKEKDYSARAEVMGADEVGVFTRAFNQMLDRIEMDDAALRQAKANLEQEVQERRRAEAALQESEERYRTAVENSTVGLYRSTPAGRVLMANPALQQMLGYDSFEELVRLDLAQEGYAEPGERQRFQARVELENEIRGAEGRWRRRDGRIIFIRESAKAVRDTAGKVLYYEGTVEDVTAQKEAELELQRLNRELMAASRLAGMAEVASGVLHNVGNVLNSVNVSATLLADQVAKSKIQSLVRAAGLLRDHLSDVGHFLSHDPKGKMLPGYLLALADHLAGEQRAWSEELKGLTRNVEHIKEIVAMQQSYARVAGVTEVLEPRSLLEDALQINEAGLRRHHVEIIREYQEVPRVAVDKHKVLQILVNLIRNAKYALDHGAPEKRRLKLGISHTGSRFVHLTVEDNGVGIAPENLTRIFAHGFTTKKDGHGFGLHSGALAAHEMGGALTAHSDGPGCGARFTLSLPIAEERNQPP